MLVEFFLLLTILYTCALALLYKSWLSVPSFLPDRELEGKLKLTVVVAVRNEEENILHLLNDLEQQRLSFSSFEVIVVDDQSEDNTVEQVQAFQQHASYSLKLLKLSLFGAAQTATKKAALHLGIQQAKGDIIITTDGDCRVSADWLLLYYNFFLVNPDAAFVAGLVTFNSETSLFEEMQTIEFASLVGSGAASLQMGNPGMCNAANLAFSKKIYQEVGGYEGSHHVPSGDDEFLLQKIYKQYPSKVYFLKSNLAVVTTKANRTFKQLLHQRIRWAGKWKLHKSWYIKILAISVFLFHLIYITLMTIILIQGTSLLYFLMILFIKFMTEFLFLQSVLRYCNKKIKILPFILLQVLYSFYVVFFAFAANFGSFSWKGRKYNYRKV